MNIKSIINANQDETRYAASNWVSHEEERIIEIGCNTGNFATVLEKRHISNYIGIDIDADAIQQARKLHPKFKFYCTDITENLYYLTKASMIVSFYSFQYIKDDLIVLNNIPPGTKIILSVPNSSYKNYHVRWFELEGWEERFSEFINFDKIITSQTKRKPGKKLFLFRGVRNNYIDKETIKFFRDVTFDNMMFSRNL